MDAVIKAEHLTHIYSKGTPFEKAAIRDVSVEIYPGQLVAVIGHTGSGKSTFIQHLNGLLRPDEGTVYCEGEDIFATKEATRDVRFKVGLVFQYPEYQLFEETVYRDIAFGPKNMKLSDAEVDERVREAARFVGISEDLFEKSPLELSGGQKRRIAIAGVIAMRPHVLILDEPMAGLDPGGCEGILRNITDYRRETGSTVLFVTHSMDDAARIADRLIVFHDGGIAMDGTPEEVFSHAQELTEMGLDVPQPAAIAAELRRRRARVAQERGERRMLKDITLGQFFPGNTIVHRLDARTKLILVIVYIAALFTAVDWFSYALMFAVTAACVALSKIKLGTILKGLKPLIFIIVLTGVLNLFYTTGGKVLVDWWIFTITTEGIKRAFLMIVRIMMLITGTFLLTYTTSPIALTDGLEILLGPLKKIKVPVHEMSMMMSMALRFIPTLIEETDKIMSAQKARGADFETGKLTDRAKALLPLLVPLFVSSFRRADELAVAMESRCYHGGEGRTRMKQLHMHRRDWLALLLGALVLAATIVMNVYGL